MAGGDIALPKMAFVSTRTAAPFIQIFCHPCKRVKLNEEEASNLLEKVTG